MLAFNRKNSPLAPPRSDLRTRDNEHYDEDEHFFIVNRLKELMKYKGFRVLGVLECFVLQLVAKMTKMAKYANYFRDSRGY